MKITVESTTKVVYLSTPESKGHSVPARVWEGHTESGIAVQCLVTRIAASKTENLAQFMRELEEERLPSAEVQAYPLRMVL